MTIVAAALGTTALLILVLQSTIQTVPLKTQNTSRSRIAATTKTRTGGAPIAGTIIVAKKHKLYIEIYSKAFGLDQLVEGYP